jgi:N-acyl-D-aspartate/D-glutamate deacylase/pimeloyl-ACP methyl ester carboxylesterase
MEAMDVDAWFRAGRRHSVGGHRLFVADSDPEGAAAKPALLLLHGFPTASFDWAKVWPRLSARHRCVAPDLLGFGFSDKPHPHDYSIGEQADLVEGLVDALGLGPHHLLAHDYGDTVAQELLARDAARPAAERRLRSVAFLNGGLFPETHRARPIQKLLATPFGPALTRVFARRSFDRSFARVFGPDTKPSPAELEAFWRLVEHGGGRHVFTSLIGYMEERRRHRARWVGALTGARCPLQLIAGARDPVSGAHMVARYREVVGPGDPERGDVVELPDVGHYPQVEAPERVLEAYLGWRDRLEAPAPPRWDLLIAGATVFDGTGAPPRVEDVALRDGRVAARGPRLDRARAAEVVEAAGRWLTPGLLDIHTHFDLELELEPGLPEAIRHGSTTVVVGNCSLGLAYGHLRDRGGDPVVDCFARVENVPKPVLRAVADRASWTTSAEYLEHLEAMPLGPNVVPLVPHSMLRIAVMGLEGSIRREPTEGELAAMTGRVERAMEEGYAGFSTDALPFHYLANDPHRKAKIPGQHASFAELRRLLEPVRRHDRVWQATPPKDSPLEVARLFSLTSGRLFGRPLRTTAVAALDVESNRGLVVLGRVLSQILNGPLGGRFRLQALAAPFKTWAEGPITPLAEEIEPLRVLNEPDVEDRAAREAILADPAWQARFLAMWRDGKAGVSLARLRRWLRLEDYAIERDLDVMVVERAPVPEWSGETLGAIHRRLQRHQAGDRAAARSEAEREAFDAFAEGDDAQFVLDLLRRFDRELVWWTVSANRDEAGWARRLEDPLVLPGFSDSGAHLVNMAFFDVNLRALRVAARAPDAEAAVARMVRRLTTEPAAFFGLDAGSLEPGARADLVLLDPEALRAWDPEATVERLHRPALGAEQLVNRPRGVVRSVWVAGRRLYDGERFAETLGTEPAGRPLRARNRWPSRRELAPDAPPAPPSPAEVARG